MYYDIHKDIYNSGLGIICSCIICSLVIGFFIGMHVGGTMTTQWQKDAISHGKASFVADQTTGQTHFEWNK